MADLYVCPDDGREFRGMTGVLKHEEETGHEVGIQLQEFFCEACRRWTSPDPVRRDADPGAVIRCAACGEYYTCGECGFDINTLGECTRPSELGVCPAREPSKKGSHNEHT